MVQRGVMIHGCGRNHIAIAYLGTADDLLKRVRGLTEGLPLKSYYLVAVAAMLQVAQQLNGRRLNNPICSTDLK